MLSGCWTRPEQRTLSVEIAFFDFSLRRVGCRCVVGWRYAEGAFCGFVARLGFARLLKKTNGYLRPHAVILMRGH